MPRCRWTPCSGPPRPRRALLCGLGRRFRLRLRLRLLLLILPRLRFWLRLRLRVGSERLRSAKRQATEPMRVDREEEEAAKEARCRWRRDPPGALTPLPEQLSGLLTALLCRLAVLMRPASLGGIAAVLVALLAIVLRRRS